MSIKYKSTLFMVVLLLPFFLFSQSKSDFNLSKEIIPEQNLESEVIGNKRVEVKSGIVRAIYSPYFSVNNDVPERMAKQYLAKHAIPLLKKADINDLEHKGTVETPGGFRVQFVQKAAGYPVYGSDIKISINRNNKVVFVTNNYQPIGQLQNDISLDPESAMQISKNYIGISGKLVINKAETVVFSKNSNKSVIAYKVNLVPAEDHFGDWELIVDASNGKILRAEDLSCYYHPDGDGVSGSGWVFDPDPITNAATEYGEAGFTDNNDADSDSLTGQLKEVELLDISFDGTNYKLEGPYAVIVDLEAPFTGTYEQDSNNFHFTRSNRAFEATMCYHHVDRSMRYINDSLGFDVMPFQYEGGVQFDAHGFNDAVNAHYVRSEGYISFGSPSSAVDLGEDNAVVLHELAHGIHDWITNGGISQVDGLSEGLSDYWAQSYTRSLNKYQPGDEGYDWFGVWGGQPNWNGPSLRVTNIDSHYPEDLTGSVHYDGQMWSSSLMSIYDIIGKTATDMDCWEGISMLNGSSSQRDAAMAFLQADNDLYDGAHYNDIYGIFYNRGYVDEALIADFAADITAGEGPLLVNFSDSSISYLGEVNSWQWDLDGDGQIDSYEQNPSYTYTEVGIYDISLTVSDSINEQTLFRSAYISVNDGFFIFEIAENERDYSGTFIKEFLEERGYSVSYNNVFPSSFDGFDAIFISCGNYGDNFSVIEDNVAASLNDYLTKGGKVYLESGSNLSHFQNDNVELLDLFGLASATMGTTNDIDGLAGADDAFTKDMLFLSSKQTSVDFIETYVTTNSDNSKPAFSETDYGDVAVLNTGDEYDQKTFCFAYSLAELDDNTPQSSRYNFMVNLMEFFGYEEQENYVVANFKANSSSILPNEELQFTDWSISAPGTSVESWAWDFNMDGNIDSYEQNPTFEYTLGGIFDIMLIASNGMTSDTLIKEDFITVRSGILVYEGERNTNGFSGTFINDYLEEYSYNEIGYTNTFPATLDGYDVVFLSFGNSGYKGTELSDAMTNTIFSYGLGGGRIYAEGGDFINSFPNTWLFGVQSVDNGSNHDIEDLRGHEDALTSGLQFDSTNQLSVTNIDQYSAMGSSTGAKAAFEEVDYGVVAVEFDGSNANGQKTFVMSYALAELADGDDMNTRNELLSRILNFFDVVSAIEDFGSAPESHLKVFPNPAKNQITLLFEVKDNSPVQIELFDLSGKIVSSDMNTFSKGTHETTYDISGLSTGVYYYRFSSENETETIKWVKVD